MADDDDTAAIKQLKAVLRSEGDRKAEFEACLDQLLGEGIYTSHELLISSIDVVFFALRLGDDVQIDAKRLSLTMEIYMDGRRLKYFMSNDVGDDCAAIGEQQGN